MMSRRELNRSKAKAAAKLIPPVVMTGLLVAFHLNSDDLFDNPIVWLWVVVIAVTATMAIRDLFQSQPRLVLDEAGLNDGRTFPWNSIAQMTLVERRYGPKRSQFLVLERLDGSKFDVEVSDLQLSPREAFELTHRFWVDHRDRILPATTGRPQKKIAAVSTPTPAATTPTCPSCGAAVDEDDWECSHCYERLI